MSIKKNYKIKPDKLEKFISTVYEKCKLSNSKSKSMGIAKLFPEVKFYSYNTPGPRVTRNLGS